MQLQPKQAFFRVRKQIFNLPHDLWDTLFVKVEHSLEICRKIQVTFIDCLGAGAFDTSTPQSNALFIRSDRTLSSTPGSIKMKVVIKKWHAVATWRWDMPEDEVCGICRVQFDGTCPTCKYPGDDCTLLVGKCGHSFHMVGRAGLMYYDLANGEPSTAS